MKIEMSDLVMRVAAETGDAKMRVKHTLEALLKVIDECVQAGHTVRLTNFGQFETFYRKPRPGAKVRTKDPFIIPARVGVKFVPSMVLKRKLGALSERIGLVGEPTPVEALNKRGVALDNAPRYRPS